MYALVLLSDLNDPNDWICYCLNPELSAIHELNCFPPEKLYLPKEKYGGILLPEVISKLSCYNGMDYPCQVLELTADINITQFNL